MKSQAIKYLNSLATDETTKKDFFKKFEQLTPTQFLYINDHYDIVSRIYELYVEKDEYNSLILNVDDYTAHDLIDYFLENIDEMIEETKRNSV